MSKPFASSADLTDKTETLVEVAPGVLALTAEGDPNVGAVIGHHAALAIEARATPVMAEPWVQTIRRRAGRPIHYLFLTHYHAVRTLGAAAFRAEHVLAHQTTAALIEERGQEDFESEAARMPRLFRGIDSIPGLTRPTVTFSERMTVDLGGRRVELLHLGRGHTEGDAVAWLPEERVLFAGDLVEAQAALYTGDAIHREWMSTTLDRVAALGADVLIGGRGHVVRGRAVGQAIEQTREFLLTLHDRVAQVRARRGTLKEAFESAYGALKPRFGGWPIFEHCVPFNVSRIWDELGGVERPRIWTARRDREVWDQLQS
jgi:glyoxylase-like metal-dependent hydrolase (beta-lactamase superfamily II)